MTVASKAIQTLSLGAMLLLVSHVAFGQKDFAPARPSVSPVNSSVASQQIRLRFIDGGSIQVDDAWESERGIWYRQSGMSHLVARDRIKAIERGSSSQPSADLQISNFSAPMSPAIPAVPATDLPVWIHLVGGARFEADSATESAAGVWYSRGSLSVFIERVRIDHVERGPLETLAESDSASKKERGWTTGNQWLDGLIRQNGLKYGVDPYLIFCVMEQESHFNSRALSPKGARGLMQLMPGTAARFGVRRASDPAQNIAGGTRYLQQLIGQFDGRIDLVLASYNAGEGAVLKFGRRVPPYRETRDYVRKISYRYRRTKSKVFSKGELAGRRGTGVPPVIDD